MEASAASSDAKGFFARHWKWFVLGTLFYSTFLNYLDRQTLSVALDPIAREFSLDIEQRGRLLATFVYVYAFSHLFIGFVLDRAKNLRWFFPAMLIGWSAVTMLMGFARSYRELLVLRALLGVFECINFPICLLLISRIFPRDQRAFACGIYLSGSVVATLVAPKLVIFLATALHWRVAFFVSGGLGVTWLVPWLLIFRHPEKRSASWSIATETTPAEPAVGAGRESLATILRRPAFWAVAGVGVGLIPGGYFISQWLPSYFTHEWKIPYDQALGDRLVFVYLAQDAGLWLGGWWALKLATARRGALEARRRVIFMAYFLAMSVMLLPLTKSLAVATGLICAYVFALGCWNANMNAFKQEVSARHVATVAALVGFCETGFSAFVVDRIGTIAKNSGGFAAVFPLLGIFLSLSMACILVLFRPRYFPLSVGIERTEGGNN
jgi:MFS transporter, ACS family, hexuronate transporter